MVHKINLHNKNNFGTDTLEFNVKYYGTTDVSDEDMEFEWETGSFINDYADKCYKEILKKFPKIGLLPVEVMVGLYYH